MFSNKPGTVSNVAEDLRKCFHYLRKGLSQEESQQVKRVSNIFGRITDRKRGFQIINLVL